MDEDPYLRKIRPETDYGLRFPFAAFGDSPKPKGKEAFYDEPPDDIPTSSYSYREYEIILALANLAEWCKDFDNRYDQPMHRAHNMFLRQMRWIGGASKGLEGRGAANALIQVGKMYQEGKLINPETQTWMDAIRGKKGGPEQ